MNMSANKSKPFSLARAIFACALTASLSLAGITALSLWRSRLHALANAETVAANLAEVINRQNLMLTNSLRFAIEMIDERHRHLQEIGLQAPDFGQTLSNIPSINNALVRALVLWDDRDRKILDQNLTSAATQPVTDQQIGDVLFDRSIRDIQIGSPIFNNNEKWLVPFVKSITNGEQDGERWILLFIDLDQIQNMISGLDIGSRGSFVVFRPDGQIVTLSPYDASKIGTFPAAAKALRRNWTSNSSRILNGRSIFDGTQQIIGYKKIDSNHTVAVVSLSEDDTLAQWRGKLWSEAAVMALCVGVLFGLGKLTGNAARHHEQVEHDLQVTLEQLGHAKEAAERANSAKTRFLTSMSHEIRTPLNAILGLPLLARERCDGDRELMRQLDLIEKAGHALLTVINDVLDLAKIEAGRVELDQRPVAIRSLVEDALAIIRPLADQRNLALSYSVEDSFPAAIIVDEARLRQVLLNLLNNAVKFTSSGEIDLTVAAAPSKDLFSIAVRDTGMGILPKHFESLFRDFEQIDNSGSRQFGGTGLGLSISRRLVGLMGGTIRVHSRHGVGSTFTIQLPLLVSQIEDERCDSSLTGHVPTSALRILVVDDVEVNREIVAHMLRKAGHRVETADTGPRGIEAYRIRRHDLILMDVQMPHMDGLDATRHIRALDEAGQRVPIIALTANVFAQQIEEYQAAGLNDHIGKPIQAGKLLSVIERWIDVRAEGLPATDVRAEPAHVDRDSQARMRDELGHGKFRQLLRSFQTDLQSRLTLRDSEAVKRDAHAIKSAAEFLGFTGLADIARETEQLLLQGADPRAALERLGPACTATVREIDNYLQRAEPSRMSK